MNKYLIKNNIFPLRIFLILIILIITIGCSGSRVNIIAPSVSYPVSLSPAIRDTDGRILMEDKLEKVGSFKYKYTTKHMLWMTIALNKTNHDISGELNRQINAAGGEAVVNFTINGISNDWNYWSSSVIGLFGLVFPGYAKFETEGDIVRRKSLFSEIEGLPLSGQVEIKDDSV